MADIQVQPAFGVSLGVSTSGETQPFDLQDGPNVVQAVSYVSAVGTSVQVALQAYSGPDISFPAAWVNVITLPSQSSAGVQSATAVVPGTVNTKFRLTWTVVGAGATLAVFALAVG